MKVFITGISGLLGLNLALQIRERFQTSGCYHTHPVALDAIQAFSVDMTSCDAARRALTEVHPDVIVHTAGLTNVEICEASPELAHRLNVEATQHVATIAAGLEARLVHISTDHFLDGSRPWKTEEHLVTPLNLYAKTKWQAEQEVRRICPGALIIRTNFYGWGTPAKVSFSDWILRSLQQQTELTMFHDVLFTPILINDLVDVIMALIRERASGIFHVAGRERLSKFEFASQVADIFGHSKDPIRAISVAESPLRARRPKDMSLSSRKVESLLRITMPCVREGLERLRNLRQKGWPQALEQAYDCGATV